MVIKKGFMVILTLLIGAGIAGGLVLLKKNASENEEIQNLRQVLTYPIQLQDLPRTIRGQAMVNSAETLTLHSQVTGEVVFSLDGLKEGVSFKKDDRLLSLDSSSIDSQLQISETALLKSLSSMISSLTSQNNEPILTKWKSFRTQILQNGPMPALPGGSSEWERLYISQFGIPDIYYQWKELSRKRDLHDFYAPFDGQIHSTGHSLGSLIFQGQEIASLVNPEKLETSLALTMEESRYLDSSQEVKVMIYDQSDYLGGEEGILLRSSGLLDSRTQTRNIYIGFDNSESTLNLLPGSYAYIEIEGDPIKQAIEIPRELLNQDQSISILENGKLKKLAVEIAGYRKNQVIVTGKDLTDGLELIVTRLQVPLEGMALEKLSQVDQL